VTDERSAASSKHGYLVVGAVRWTKKHASN